MKSLKLAAIAASAWMAIALSLQAQEVVSAAAATPPWEVEKAIKNSPMIQEMQAKIARIEAEHESMKAAKSASSLPVGAATAKVVRKADGSCVCQICDENGCREIACDCSGVGVASVVTYPGTSSAYQTMVCGPGGCSPISSFSSPYVFTGYSEPMFSYGGGSCASGNCGGGQSEGKRGLFGRRRR